MESVHIFERGAGGWVHDQTLVGTGGFGLSADIDGDRAAVGAPLTKANPLFSAAAGAAYIFEKNSTGWMKTARLRWPTAELHQSYLGWSIDLDGDRVVVGGKGRAMFCERQGPDWVVVAPLEHDGTAVDDEFGHSVALDGDVALVGSPSEKHSGHDTGAVHVYERIGGAWQWTGRITSPDDTSLDRFGQSVALSGQRVLVGAPGEDVPVWNGGAAYVYERCPTGWCLQAKLVASDTAQSWYLGSSVALDGDVALVGPLDYVWKQIGGAWTQVAKVVAPDWTAFGAAGGGRAASIAGGRVALLGRESPVLASKPLVFDLASAGMPLQVTPAPVSLSAGGSSVFVLNAGPQGAGQAYLLLGSARGTAPGIPIGPSLVLPLVPDAYFFATLQGPGASPLLDANGTLGTAGQALAELVLPALSDPSLAGTTLHHAYVAMDAATFAPSFVSNAVASALVP